VELSCRGKCGGPRAAKHLWRQKAAFSQQNFLKFIFLFNSKYVCLLVKDQRFLLTGTAMFRACLISTILVFCCFLSVANASSLLKYKNACNEIGFTKGTEAFGNCVLKLRKKANEAEAAQAKQEAEENDAQQAAAQLYALNKLIRESRAQHEEQKRAYERAMQRERQRRAGAALMQFGLGLAQTGQVPSFDYSSGGFKPPAQTDLTCVNRCISLGFLLANCRSKCSF